MAGVEVRTRGEESLDEGVKGSSRHLLADLSEREQIMRPTCSAIAVSISGGRDMSVVVGAMVFPMDQVAS